VTFHEGDGGIRACRDRSKMMTDLIGALGLLPCAVDADRGSNPATACPIGNRRRAVDHDTNARFSANVDLSMSSYGIVVSV
jgi:hypothetical protein